MHIDTQVCQLLIKTLPLARMTVLSYAPVVCLASSVMGRGSLSKCLFRAQWEAWYQDAAALPEHLPSAKTQYIMHEMLLEIQHFD